MLVTMMRVQINDREERGLMQHQESETSLLVCLLRQGVSTELAYFRDERNRAHRSHASQCSDNILGADLILQQLEPSCVALLQLHWSVDAATASAQHCIQQSCSHTGKQAAAVRWVALACRHLQSTLFTYLYLGQLFSQPCSQHRLSSRHYSWAIRFVLQTLFPCNQPTDRQADRLAAVTCGK